MQFPINNNCSTNTSLLRDLKLGSLGVQYAAESSKHVKKTLPPTLGGFPGEAEIKYYVKATVSKVPLQIQISTLIHNAGGPT